MSIKDELLALKNSEGFIVCERAVEWAKANPSSELHGALEWNDREAAHQFRLVQVRHLIALHVINDEGKRKMVSLSIDRSREGGGYRDLDDVMPVKSLRDVLLDDAFKELERVKTKYARLQELSAVWAETEKAKEATTKRRRRGSEARPAA